MAFYCSQAPGCICEKCLYRWSGRCPHGRCYDDLRAKQNPYDKAHPDKPPRTSWSNWKEDQAYWCRGGILYQAYECEQFVEYDKTKTIVKECLEAVIQVLQDGYIQCSLVDLMGCEECMRRFEDRINRKEDEELAKQTYWTKCGRKFEKNSTAGVTGYHIPDGDMQCEECPFRLEVKEGWPPLFKRWECRAGSLQPNQSNDWKGSLEDKNTIHVYSLHQDFLEAVMEYCQATEDLGGQYNQDSEDCRRTISVSCSSNKKGIAAKKALIEEFFATTNTIHVEKNCRTCANSEMFKTVNHAGSAGNCHKNGGDYPIYIPDGKCKDFEKKEVDNEMGMDKDHAKCPYFNGIAGKYLIYCMCDGKMDQMNFKESNDRRNHFRDYCSGDMMGACRAHMWFRKETEEIYTDTDNCDNCGSGCDAATKAKNGNKACPNWIPNHSYRECMSLPNEYNEDDKLKCTKHRCPFNNDEISRCEFDPETDHVHRTEMEGARDHHECENPELLKILEDKADPKPKEPVDGEFEYCAGCSEQDLVQGCTLKGAEDEWFIHRAKFKHITDSDTEKRCEAYRTKYKACFPNGRPRGLTDKACETMNRECPCFCKHNDGCSARMISGKTLLKFLQFVQEKHTVSCDVYQEVYRREFPEQENERLEALAMEPVKPEDRYTDETEQAPAAAFDYSTVDTDTAAFLQDKEAKITQIRMMSVMAIGKELKEVHEKLANNKTGTFGAWCKSIGMSDQSAMNYIRAFEYIAKNFGNIEDADQIQPSLLFAISKPSAPKELQEKVLSGDITTHKQYKEMEQKLREAETKAQEAMDMAVREGERRQKADNDAAEANNQLRLSNAAYTGLKGTHEIEIKKLLKQIEEAKKSDDALKVAVLEKRVKDLEVEREDLLEQLAEPVHIEPAVVHVTPPEIQAELDQLREQTSINNDYAFVSENLMKLLNTRPTAINNWADVIRRDRSLSELMTIRNNLDDIRSAVDTMIDLIEKTIQSK